MLIKRGEGDFTKVYRPCRISEVIGQDKIKTIIKNSLDKGKVNHSYLFFGDRGSGKTTFARIIALGLNCLETKNPSEPCCECDACVSILSNSSPDYLEINVSDKTGVNDVRELIKTFAYSNFSLKNKVVILDECHQMTAHAQNALLKPIEDYKENLYVIFCTTDTRKIIPTLRDRCKEFRFDKLRVTDIVLALENICQFEGLFYSKKVLDLIASTSTSIRDAIINLQTVAVAEKLNDFNWVKNFLGMVSDEEELKFNKLISAIIGKDWNKSVIEFRKLLKEYNVEEINSKLFELFSYRLLNSKSAKQAYLFYSIGACFNNTIYSPSEFAYSLYSAVNRR